MACVGSIQEQRVPVDVYIAGVESEGVTTFATPGEILYLNGSGVSFLKPGSTQRVIRPEGKVRDGRTDAAVGIYYKDIGTIRIESVDQESATARVLLSCEGMLKGDLVIPGAPKSAVEFNGELSRDVTPVPRGLSSSILLARDDARQLAAGHFCFIPVGTRDGVKPGDRFTIFRPAPSFNPRDMATAGSGADLSYSRTRDRFHMESKLHARTIPPRVLGDIVIVEAGEGISTGKIINSLSEIVPGDRVVKR